MTHDNGNEHGFEIKKVFLEFLLAIVSGIVVGIVVGVVVYYITEGNTKAGIVDALSSHLDFIDSEMSYETAIDEVNRKLAEQENDNATLSTVNAELTDTINMLTDELAKQKVEIGNKNKEISQKDTKIASTENEIEKQKAIIDELQKKTNTATLESEIKSEVVNTLSSRLDFISQGMNFDAAIDEISNRLNKQQAKAEEAPSDFLIYSENAVYFVDTLKPYTSNKYKEIINATAVTMGGKRYQNGFILEAAWMFSGGAHFNLDKKYKNLSGVIGYVDSEALSAQTVDIYADDNLIYTHSFSVGDLPQEFSIDVTDVAKLEFHLSTTSIYDSMIGFAELKIS